jgi:multidrug transporter EmrE-like cation transporter
VSGYAELVVSTTLYSLGIVAQTVAAQRADRKPGTGLGLLARLAKDRLYLLGFAGQVGGFGFAFLARAQLPLYLVQAGSSCAVGLATAFGLLVLKWRVRPVEIAVLLMMATGLILLVAASETSVAKDIPTVPGLILLGLPLLVIVFCSRAAQGMNSVAVSVLAGTAFAVIAIIGRSVADEPLPALLLNPLTWLMVVAAVVGQSCLALALQRGTATSSMAAMDATTVVLTSVIGIGMLGDRITPGWEWAVGFGMTLVVAGVLALGSPDRAPAGVAG